MIDLFQAQRGGVEFGRCRCLDAVGCECFDVSHFEGAGESDASGGCGAGDFCDHEIGGALQWVGFVESGGTAVCHDVCSAMIAELRDPVWKRQGQKCGRRRNPLEGVIGVEVFE